MVAFLQKSTESEEFHQIVDFLADSHIRYALTANPTIYAFLIEQFWQTATVETINNGEQQLSVIVDGQTIAITEASVRRHLQLADAYGISSLPNTEIFEQLTLIGKTMTRTRRMGIRIPQSDVPLSVVDEAIIKEMNDGLVRATTTASSLKAEQGSGNIAKTQTKATSSGPSFPRTSSEGGLGCHFTMRDIPVQARPEKIKLLHWRMNLQALKLSTTLITLTKRVKKLEKQLKHKRRRAIIDSSEDEGPSLVAEDSPKQGRMIKEIDNDETVNLVKSKEPGKSHDTAEHRMESEHDDDDDDRTLAETMLNIKRSTTKGKAIMQESEPLKKIKKKEMIQISLDEEFAKKRIPQEAKQTDEREKVINWNDLDVLRYHAVQNRPFSKAEVRKNMCTYLKNQGGYKMSYFKGMSYEDIRPIFERVRDQNQAFVPKDSEIEKEVMKRPGFDLQQESSKKTGGSRKKTLARKRAGEKQSKEGAKRQKTEYEKEKEELKAYLDLVPREEFAMEIESLGTKYPIVDWKTHVLTENFMYYQIIRADGGSKNYKIFSEMLDDFDRQDVMDLHRLVEERYATSRPEGYDLMLWGDLKILFQPDEEDEVWRHQHEYNLISWRLFDSCGIHILLMDNGIAIHMMIEKKYPLTQEMLSKMLSRKLEVDHENEMAFELLRFIRSQVTRYLQPAIMIAIDLGACTWTIAPTSMRTNQQRAVRSLLERRSPVVNPSKGLYTIKGVATTAAVKQAQEDLLIFHDYGYNLVKYKESAIGIFGCRGLSLVSSPLHTMKSPSKIQSSAVLTGSEEFHHIVKFLAGSHIRATTFASSLEARQGREFCSGSGVGSIRRIQYLGYGVLGFLGVGTTFDIFQNIQILYLQYGVLVFSGYGVLIMFTSWSLVLRADRRFKELQYKIFREMLVDFDCDNPSISDKVTSLEDELASTKAVYNKALITITKKGRMIDEIDKDENVNLVKSRELGKSHDTAEHRTESEHDDDDRTLAETLLNIKRSAAKEQAQILQDEIYAKQVEAQWIADEERIPQEAKYHAVQNRPFSKAEAFVSKDSEIEKEVMKRPGFDLQQESSKKTEGNRKKTLSRKRAGEKQSKEGAKRQKTKYDKEKEELKAYLDLVPREEFAMEIESLGIKYPIVDWKTHVLTENFMYYQIIRADGGSKNYKIFSEMLDDLDRYDVMDLHILVEERYATSRPEGYDLMLWGDLKILFQPDKEDEVWRHQHEYKLISWRLFDSCGIHILLMDNRIAIHMMIEKKYPLTQEMLSKMLSRKLEVNHENDMAFKLLRFIRSQVQK
ncbi:hypothetical protein Tco_0053737 [Tanacetum coccineum]